MGGKRTKAAQLSRLRWSFEQKAQAIEEFLLVKEEEPNFSQEHFGKLQIHPRDVF